jgi:hypothetical protein
MGEVAEARRSRERKPEARPGRGEAVAGWWAGSALVAFAPLRLPPLRQPTTPQSFAGIRWGILIVAQGER